MRIFLVKLSLILLSREKNKFNYNRSFASPLVFSLNNLSSSSDRRNSSCPLCSKHRGFFCLLFPFSWANLLFQLGLPCVNMYFLVRYSSPMSLRCLISRSLSSQNETFGSSFPVVSLDGLFEKPTSPR